MDALQSVLEASPDAVLVIDERGVIERVNRNVRAVLGYVPDELEGKVVEDLLPETDRTRHVGFREAYMADPEPRPMGRELDLYARRRDGTSVPVEIGLGPVERDGERFVVATVADVTKRRQREEELERQNDRLDEFAKILSHDLRNPLNVAIGHLDLAKVDGDPGHLDDARRALDRMAALIEELLCLARKGETAMAVESVDLAAIVDECWRYVETEDATLVTATERTVRADRARLQQLFENLFRNAIEHAGGDVTVTVGDLDDGFYVEDDGPGIPEAARERVFESGYSTSRGGSGFGLGIVAGIVDERGWEVTVNEGNPTGARFEIRGFEPG